MLERWTRFVLRHRPAVLCCWLVLLGVGVACALRLPPLLANSFTVPGTDSARAGEILTSRFGQRTDGGFVVVFRVGATPSRAVRVRLQALLAAAARAVPGGRAGRLTADAGLLYADVDTTLPLHVAKGYTPALRRALRAPGGPPTYVTGEPAIQHDLDPILASDLLRGEAIALPVALLVLLAVLGLSAAVLVPFAFAACTIAATLAVLYGLAHLLPVVTYVSNLVELIGLGLAIDYSLLVVHRCRDELARGAASDEAIVATMATAGRATVLSGGAVAIGLAVLLLVPVPFIRSLGLGAVLVPLVSIVASLTLQPALLSLLGRRGVGRPAVAARVLGRRRAAPAGGGLWAALAAAIMRRPRLFLAAGVAVLLAAAAPALLLRLTPGSIAGLPSSPESVRGYALLRDRVGAGSVLPTQLVVDAGAPGAAVLPPTQHALARLAAALVADPEVFIVGRDRLPPYVDPSRRFARVLVAARDDYGDPAARSLVARLRERLVPGARFPAGDRVYVGGVPAQGVDFLRRTYGRFPWLALAVLAVTFVLLLRAFRSLVLPLKAVLLNVLSVAAVYGLLVVVFRWGVGADLLGLRRASQIEAWVPIFLFALLFGVSMDYEVFLVSRMREAWDAAPDNARAVAHGLERTGRVVTAAALIMAAAFAGFVGGRVAGLQELGVGLVLAVLVDATLVRMILVPSLMAVLGRWNWWLPERVARLARTAPSPLVR